MINPFAEVNWKPDTTGKRKFALSLVIGFPCLALILLLLRRLATGGWHFELPLSLGAGGATVGLVLLALPVLAKPFYWIWYFLACCIGFVISNLVFVAFFYLLVTPTGLLRRTVGKSPVRKGLDRQVKTYWQDVDRVTELKRYYNQF